MKCLRVVSGNNGGIGKRLSMEIKFGDGFNNTMAGTSNHGVRTRGSGSIG